MEKQITLKIKGWNLTIKDGNLCLPNGKVLRWGIPTRKWIEGLQAMWNVESSQGLADLIELSTGFSAFEITT